MTSGSSVECSNFINIETEDEYIKIKDCLDEYCESESCQIELSVYSPIKPIYGYIDGYDRELSAFVNRYKGEPVIRKYMSEYIFDNSKAVLASVECSEKHDSVNHPTYYSFAHEPIDVIADWGLNFNLGNTVKYISRAGRKDPTKTLEDLKKARFYLDYEIEHFGEEE